MALLDRTPRAWRTDDSDISVVTNSSSYKTCRHRSIAHLDLGAHVRRREARPVAQREARVTVRQVEQVREDVARRALRGELRDKTNTRTVAPITFGFTR
jgi:hypothetical protein